MAGDSQGHPQHAAPVPQPIKNAAGPPRKGIQPFQKGNPALPERESSCPNTPVAVGAIPRMQGWGLILVVIPFPAPHSPGGW